MLVVSIYGEK